MEQMRYIQLTTILELKNFNRDVNSQEYADSWCMTLSFIDHIKYIM